MQTIAIPFIELLLSTFKETLNLINTSLEKGNYQPVFFVDINYVDFEPAIDYIINELQSQFIGLLFRPFRNYPQSYEVLSKYIDKDVAFFSAHVSIYENRYDDISTMHYLPFFGNDIYSVKVSVPFGSNPVEGEVGDFATHPNDISHVQFFNRQSLQVSPLSSIVVGDLRREYAHDPIISDILENYIEAKYSDEKYKVLNALSKVSEVQSSFSEFEKSQTYFLGP